MTRQVAHEEKGKLLCSCGARFKTPRDFRKHLAKANGLRLSGGKKTGR